MDAEILERLLMDRALGGLAPDVEALLAAYLAQDGAAAERAREFEAAAMAARQVLRTSGPLGLPKFPAGQIRGLERTRHQLVLVRNVTGLAAAIVAGIGLGVVFFREPATRPGIDRPPVVAASAPRGEFWSAQRLYEKSRRTGSPDAVHVIWDSAVSAPRLGEEL
jgi:hypothetical protein